MKRQRRIAALVASVDTFAAAPPVVPLFHHSPVAPAAAIALSCSAVSKHAVINGSEKCQQRGQFCANAADGQHPRSGFRRTKRDRHVDRCGLS